MVISIRWRAMIIALFGSMPALANEPTSMHAVAPPGRPALSFQFNSYFYPGARVELDSTQHGSRRIRVSGCAPNGASLVSEPIATPEIILIVYELGYSDLPSAGPCELNFVVHFVGARTNIFQPITKTKSVHLAVYKGRLADFSE